MKQKIEWLAKDIGTIANFFSADECDAYIEFSEAHGYEDAPVTRGRGMVMMKDVRNNDRVMIEDRDRAHCLYERIHAHVPACMQKTWAPVGLNECLQLYRYDIDQKFDWHSDAYIERQNGECSFYTFMVYLNDGFEGGATSFHDAGYKMRGREALRVTPRKGMALLFYHPIPHRGDVVTGGRKYVLRSDVMYARVAKDR